MSANSGSCRNLSRREPSRQPGGKPGPRVPEKCPLLCVPVWTHLPHWHSTSTVHQEHANNVMFPSLRENWAGGWKSRGNPGNWLSAGRVEDQSQTPTEKAGRQCCDLLTPESKQSCAQGGQLTERRVGTVRETT